MSVRDITVDITCPITSKLIFQFVFYFPASHIIDVQYSNLQIGRTVLLVRHLKNENSWKLTPSGNNSFLIYIDVLLDLINLFLYVGSIQITSGDLTPNC